MRSRAPGLFFTLITLCATLPVRAGDLPLPSLSDIERAQAEAGLMEAEISRLSKRQQLEALRQQFAVRLPRLVGIVTDESGQVAELLDATGVRLARPGEFVAPGWRLHSIKTDRIELVRTSARGRRYTLLLGSSDPIR